MGPVTNNRNRHHARRGAATLKVGTHNINGLRKKLTLAMKEWARLQLDVVFIQEHHISGLVHEMELGLSRRGWKAFWAFNNVGGGSSSGSSTSGVLIVVKRNLVTSGALKIAENSLKIWGPDDGRCLSINADWRGHKLQLASIYMPNDAASQKIFIESPLAPMKTAAGQRLTLWGGDFNFVHNPNLDRLSKRAAVPGEVPGMYRPPETEHTVGKFWCDQLPSVSDIWRHRHPTGRMMTHFGGRSAARLDRFYIGDDGTAYAGVNSRIQRPRRENGSFLSDHCPVVMELAQKIIEGDRGASFAPRLRMYFASENDLVTEFITWLASKKAHMPINYKARLKWWRRLKRDISRKVFRLNGIQRARQRAPVAVLREELEELYTFIEGSDPLAAATSLAALPEARQAVAAAEEALEEVFQLKQKRDWIHNHERPTRALTGQLNPKKHQGVSALRAANGEIVGTAIGCARVVTTHCAAVSAKPTTTNAAQNLVLDAMERQGSPVLDSGRAEVLGSVVVTEQEVLVALRRSKPGKAPGRDGIPVELYKKFKTQFVPILAGVFTAIGVLKNLPCGFLDGVITVLYKKGDRVDAGNYRPISLTNTDYRVLARVLAGRLGEVLPDLVDPAQTAFIKGRCIGDNAMLLQFVAALLKEEGRSAVLALCDFRKAYDTVDRYFLLAVATKLGLGHGFVQWVRLLLEGTLSAAIINGYLAEPKLLLAGVRQGCPLAPLLYLLIGQALLCWIKDQGIGIQIAGSLLSGSQFADDLKALLDGPQQIPAFKAAMATFATASGQHLLPAKTQLLFIGVPPTQPLPAVTVRLLLTCQSINILIISAITAKTALKQQ
ncbi:putative LINE-1 retrotransposable element ORF2 protein [Nannochloris sp. 'desiccata']|nr:putative LINE-1 retrotransposable element ORF2 protein [Chlorella desiccata (nom. nud.)]